MDENKNYLDYQKILGITPGYKFAQSISLEFSLHVMASLKQQDLRFDSVLEFGTTSNYDTVVSPFAGRNLIAFKEFFPNLKRIEGNDIFCPKEGIERDGIRYTYGDMYGKLSTPDKSFDLVLLSAMFMPLPEEDVVKSINEAKRIARKYVVVIDIHNEALSAKDTIFEAVPETLASDYNREKSGHRVMQLIYLCRFQRNFRSYFPEAKKVVIDRMPKKLWPGESYKLDPSILTFYL